METDAYADWESVYRDNVARLYRLMYSRVGNRPDAEDLTSEVFKVALRPLRLGSSKGESCAPPAHHGADGAGLPIGVGISGFLRPSIDPEADSVYLVEPSGSDPPSTAPVGRARYWPPSRIAIVASSSGRSP